MDKSGMKPQPTKPSPFADKTYVPLSAKADCFVGCGFIPLCGKHIGMSRLNDELFYASSFFA